jgi:predicted GH43/DUF377 family glycosyl hydrolase
MWRADWLGLANSLPAPASIGDDRPGIWISYIRAVAVDADVRAITTLHGHRCVALCEYDYENAKIGAGPPPVRVPEGWLLVHHGVAGELAPGFNPGVGGSAVYCSGAMLLDADDPSRVLDRTAEPLMRPEMPDELVGTVANVVFPTAIAAIGDRQFVFYGMADSRIGVAELTRH